MTENETIACIVGGFSFAGTVVQVTVAVLLRKMSHGEHQETLGDLRETKNITQQVHDIVTKNGQGKEKHP